MPTDPLLPSTTPRTFLGQRVEPMAYDGYGPIPQGFTSAALRSAATNWLEVKQRWAATTDAPDEPGMVYNDWKELVGERKLEYSPGFTRNEVERQIAIYDRDEYVSQFENRPVAEFFGAIPPLMLDPVSIVTMPVGNANFAKALGESAFSGFIKQSAVGGAKAGVASVPLEAAVQQQTTGEISPGQVAATALGSVVAAPLMLAPFRALQGLGKAGDAAGARALGEHPNFKDTADPARASAVMADSPEVPAPPITPRSEMPRVKPVELADGFADYEGGVRAWVRGMAADEGRALEHARAMGFDPANGALRQVIAQIGEASAVRSTTPPDYHAQLLMDMRSATPEARARLRQNGVLDNSDNVREPYRDLFNAATTEPAQRSPLQRGAVQNFIDEGPAPFRARAVSQLNEQIKVARAELRDLVDLTRTKKQTKRLQELRGKLQQARNRVVALEVQRQNLTQAPRIIDDQIPDERLFEMLDAVRLEREPAPVPPQEIRGEAEELARQMRDAPPPRAEGEAARPFSKEPGATPGDAELEQWAREGLQSNGLSAEESEQVISGLNDMWDTFSKRARECIGG